MAIKEKFHDLCVQGNFAGGALLIRRDGQEIHRQYEGLRDIENALPVDGDTIFRLASMTKPVVAVCVMILEERGMLSLDDPIQKYIPAFEKLRAADRMVGFMDVYEPDPDNPTVPKFNPSKLDDIHPVPLERPVTIRHLLTHSSGMGQGPYSAGPLGEKNRTDMTLEERVNMFAEVPLDFQPGTFSSYSATTGFDILGRLVELLSGMDLETFTKTNICGPLGIRDMGFHPTDEHLSRLAKLYAAKDGQLTDIGDSDELCRMFDPRKVNYLSGSAAMFGSLNAYDRFVQMLANGGELDGARILKAETVTRMADPRNSVHEMGSGQFWGLGMMVRDDPEKAGSPLSKGSYGWSGAYGTHFFIDPVKRLTGVMVMNVSNIGGAGSPIIPVFEKGADELV